MGIGGLSPNWTNQTTGPYGCPAEFTVSVCLTSFYFILPDWPVKVNSSGSKLTRV